MRSFSRSGYRSSRAEQLATTLTEGCSTHDSPISVEMARELGLPVSNEMPELVYAVMEPYPQAGGGRSSVTFAPLREKASGPCEMY